MKEDETVLEDYNTEELYPKFDRTDSEGNPICDARFYSFTSRTIASVNKMIRPVKYETFKLDEIEYY